MPLKVLTVDDSKTIRMIVKKAFKPFDCSLFEAENGVEGLAAAAKEKPDLIVLDITMPVMNGAEMLQKLRQEDELKGIPVIMLTAESGTENVMKIVKMGVQDYMVKPFKGEQLIERVEKLVTLKPKEAADSDGNGAKKYVQVDGEIYCLSLPEKVDRTVTGEVEGALQKTIKEMVGGQKNKFVIDLSSVSGTSVPLIKLIMTVIQHCQRSNINVRLVGSPELGNELKEFQETSNIPIVATVEEAKTAF
jgi:two-component system cell cycle response regulator/two-component system chemotaxis response regulator CheY